MYADSGEVSAQPVQAPLLNQLQYVNKPHCDVTCMLPSGLMTADIIADILYVQ